MILLDKAIKFASYAHAEGNTKEPFRRDGKTPYITHPLAVKDKVATVTDDENILAAAVLHDTVENSADYNIPLGVAREFYLDTEFVWRFDLNAIENLFGATVAELVDQLTDKFTKTAHPQHNRAKRKQLERERYETISDDAALIKLADIIINVGDLDYNDIGFSILYVKEKFLCLLYLSRPWDDRNVKLFSEAMKTVRKAKNELDID